MRRPCRSDRRPPPISPMISSKRRGGGTDRAGQRIAAERPKSHLLQAGLLARQQRQAIVVGNEQCARTLDHRPRPREVKRNDRNVLRPDVFPHVELGPVRQRIDAHRLARREPCVEQTPELGPLVARVPDVRRRAMREDALLRPALLFVTPGAANGGIEFPFVERLAQRFGLHDVGIDRLARRHRRDAAGQPFFVDVHTKVQAQLCRGAIAKRNHLLELPGRVDVKEGKRYPRGKKAFCASRSSTLESLPME